MSSPTVACIIAAYNAERHLPAAIDSVLAQTMPAAQIIVVDDGSTDDTPDIVRRYGDRVQLVQQENRGTAAARDAGVRAATSELLTFLDSDDLFEPSKIERQVAHLQSDETIEVSLCHSADFWDEEVPVAQRAGMSLEPGKKPGQVGTWMIDRAAFDRYGPLTQGGKQWQSFAEGSSWYFTAVERGLCTAELPELLMHRRLHLNNKTRQDRQGHLDAILALAKRVADQRKAK